jgi:hypothetical protein
MVMPKGVQSLSGQTQKGASDTLQEKGVQTTMSSMGFPPRFIPSKDFEAMVRKAVADIPKLSAYVKDVDSDDPRQEALITGGWIQLRSCCHAGAEMRAFFAVEEKMPTNRQRRPSGWKSGGTS